MSMQYSLRYGVTFEVDCNILLPLVVLIFPLVALVYLPVVLVYQLVVLVCPLVVLACQLVVLVCPLVVSVCPLVVHVWPFAWPLVVLVVLSVGPFITDHLKVWIKVKCVINFDLFLCTSFSLDKFYLLR